MEENQVYKIRDGTINFGKQYEISLAALYGVLFLNSRLEDAWIATNAEECGNFDDVVVYWKEKVTNTEELFMIQCKHSTAQKTLNLSKFVNSNSGKDFFLEKYLSSYCSIIQSFTTNTVISDTAQRLKETFKCILLTNNNADADEILTEIDSELSLSVLNVRGKIKTFKSERLSELILSAALDVIITENCFYDLISEVTFDKVIVTGSLFKQTSKIKLKEVIAEDKLFCLLSKVKPFKRLPNSTNSKENLVKILSEKINKLISNTKLTDIIAEDRLNALFLTERWTKSISIEHLNKLFLDAKISTYVSKEQVNRIAEQNVDLIFEFMEKKLFLLSSQVHNEQVHQIISEEITKILPLQGKFSSDINEVVEKYIQFVGDWTQGKLGGYYLLTKSHIIGKFAELLLKPSMSQFWLSKCNNCFATESLNKWNSAIEDKRITLIDTKSDEDYSDIVQFLYGSIRNKLNVYAKDVYCKDWNQPFASTDQVKFYKMDDASLKNEILRTTGNTDSVTCYSLYAALWKLQRVPLVLESSMCENYQNILHILNVSDYKFKVIILNKSKEELLCINDISARFTNLADLTEETIKATEEEVVPLQGRPVELKELIKMHKPLRELVTTREIIHILAKTETFTIGSKLKALPKFFIPRNISKVLLDPQKFVETLNCCKSVFVVKCQGRHLFLEFLRELNLDVEESSVIDYGVIKTGNQTMTDYKILTVHELEVIEDVVEKIFAATNIHYLALDGCNLEWIKTIGNIDVINSCILTGKLNHQNGTTICANKALNHFSRQINVISASPGMGKSTIMDYLAFTTPTTTWVLRINLNQHCDYYGSKEFQKSDANTHLEYFNDCILKRSGQCTPLNKEVFMCYLQSKSILILLDGFDEISPCYKCQVTEMIKSLLLTQHRIWLTTRPALKLHVEREFNTIAVTLNSLNGDDQVEFLTKYFAESLCRYESTKEINKFALELLEVTKHKLNDFRQEFTSVPLQTMLLADAFINECRSFLDTPCFTLNENINLLYLYETFVQRKIQILANKYGNYAKQLLSSFEKYQQLYALKVVFADKDLKELKVNEQLMIYSDALNSLEEIVQKDGIIVTLDGSHLTFAHRTFAEFFIAKWLAENVKLPVVKNLIKKLFDDGYFVIRNMFDQILANGCQLHTFILNKQFDKAEELIKNNPSVLKEKDRGGRLAVHLAASWGMRHPIPKANELADPSIHKIENQTDTVGAFLTNMCENMKVFCKDEIIELTPLEYAIATDCLGNMDVILKFAKMRPVIKFSRKKIKSYLYYCARYGYDSLAKAVMSYIVRTHIQLQGSSNAIALQRRRKVGHYLNLCTRFCYSFLPKSNISFIHINSYVDNNCCAAIHVAAAFGQKQLLTFILSNGGDVNSRDKFLHTALHYAVRNGSCDNISLLLANDADVYARDEYKRTALHHASKNCSTDILSLLISYGADIHAKDKDLRTAIHHAAKNGSLANVELLFAKGANIEDKDVDKRTPLIHAAKNNYLNMVSLLLSMGANINSADYRNVTALFHATCRGYTDMASLLLSNGASTDTTDTFGQTVLDYSNMFEKFPAKSRK